MRVLVTGADGSIGSAVVAKLDEFGHEVIATDIGTLDVTTRLQCQAAILDYKPVVILHLAGAKHAPEGEQDPEAVALVNVTGTANVLHAARLTDAKVVLASTCKACDPETAYGASKLIAERMVLNQLGVVVRYYNVRETSGNVFRLWESIPESDPIPYTDCWRYFISLEDAALLTVSALTYPSGRYAVDPGPKWMMVNVARNLYPNRELVQVPRRRGDRHHEKLHADAETIERFRDRVLKITGPHDPDTEALRWASVEQAAA